MLLYDRGKPLPDDDALVARMMELSTRVWRRIRSVLMASGKIIVRNSAITNLRFEEERRKRAFELQRSSNAAKQRWAKVRGETPISQSLEEVLPKFAGSLDQTSNKLSSNFDGKPNEINDFSIKPYMPFRIQSHIEEESTYRLPMGADASEVEVNGVAIKVGPLAMPYEAIDTAGQSMGLDQEQSRKLAEMLAKGMVLRPASTPPAQPALPEFNLETSGEKKRERAKPLYSPEFDAFWTAYRKHANDMEGAKGQAAIEFNALSRADRALATAAIPKHAAKLRRTDTKFKHACRFLKNREFDNYAEEAAPHAIASNERELQIKALALDFDAKEWKHAAKIWKSREDVPKDIVREARLRSERMAAARQQPGW
jgi:uncharacterized protein YdaU (DUF1376 family)